MFRIFHIALSIKPQICKSDHFYHFKSPKNKQTNAVHTYSYRLLNHMTVNEHQNRLYNQM